MDNISSPFTTIDPRETDRERFIGLDYVRAFFSVCVVLVHLGYIARSKIFAQDTYLEHTFTFSDGINFYVLLLAVPVFFLISNFLYCFKPQDRTFLAAHLSRTGKLAVFWIGSFLIFKSSGWGIVTSLPKTVSGLFKYLLSGGHTIYYFFISLLFLIIITHFAKQIKPVYVGMLFFLSTVVVAILPLVSIATGNFLLSTFWNPINYLPYPFAAILLFHLSKSRAQKIRWRFLVPVIFLFALAAAADWTIYIDEGFFQVNRYAIPAYMRPSIVLLATGIVWVAINIRHKPNRVIRFMSNNSLALYCLHPFFVEPAKTITDNRILPSLVLVLLFSYAAGVILRKFLSKGLI